MKTYMTEALDKLRAKTFTIYNPGNITEWLVKLEDAEKALEELEIAILNDIDQKKVEESKNPY